MDKSATIKELATALGGFQVAMKPVVKDGSNPFFKSKYATLDGIIDAIKKPMKDNGLSYSQFPSLDGLATILMHSSGEWISSWMKISPKDTSPQGQGSALTYARRYSLSAILGLATDEDDDANVASGKATTDVAKPVKATRPKVESDGIL